MYALAQIILDNPGLVPLALGGMLIGAQVRGERIVQAALMVGGEVVPTGAFHDPGRVPLDKSGADMVAGFVTDTGRFVGREEAGAIAGVSGPMTHEQLEERA